MNKLNSKARKYFLIGFLVVVSPFLLIATPAITVFLGITLGKLGLLLWIPILGVIVILGYIWARFEYRNWGYEFTEGKVRIEKGVIFKDSTSIPYSKIQNVDVDQDIVERLMGLGTLKIQTAGSRNDRSDTAGIFKIIKLLHGISSKRESEGIIKGLSVDRAKNVRDGLIEKMD